MGFKRTLFVLGEGLEMTAPSIHVLMCVLGPGKAFQLGVVDNLEGYDRVLLCAPANSGPGLTQFVFDHLTELSSRSVGLINLNHDTSDPAWLPELAGLLGCQAKQSVIIAPDAPAQTFIEFGMAFRAADHRLSEEIPFAELKSYIEHFLVEHNTCTLSTCYNGQAHTTPLEYRYQAGHLYCVSEGGEKFAGLWQNKQAAVSIYEPYRGFNHLAGMQLAGKASIPPWGSEEYWQVMKIWKLSQDKILSLPILMHAIDIRLAEAIFLWSDFKAKGFDTRQVFRFY